MAKPRDEAGNDFRRNLLKKTWIQECWLCNRMFSVGMAGMGLKDAAKLKDLDGNERFRML